MSYWPWTYLMVSKCFGRTGAISKDFLRATPYPLINSSGLQKITTTPHLSLRDSFTHWKGMKKHVFYSDLLISICQSLVSKIIFISLIQDSFLNISTNFPIIPNIYIYIFLAFCSIYIFNDHNYFRVVCTRRKNKQVV